MRRSTQHFHEENLGVKSLKHRQTRKEVRTEKERFEILSEHAPFGIVLINPGGTFEYINPKFRELFGYDLNDLPDGRTWFRKAYPDPSYRHEVISAWVDDLKFSQPGEKRPEVFTVTCKDGTRKVINFIPVQIETGENIMTCEDITESLGAGEALRQSEKAARRLAQENAIIAEIGQTISSTLDIEEIYERFAQEVHKLISFDRIAIKIINPKDQTVIIRYITGVEIGGRRLGDTIPLAGTVAEELMRTRSPLLIHADGNNMVAKRFPTTPLFTGTNLRSFLSVPLISKDQVIGVLHMRSATPRAYTEKDLKLAERVGHQIAGAITTAQLFAERKKAEQALRESEEKYRTTLNNIEESYYEVDLAGNLTFFNDSVCRLLGYPREEMMGMNNRQYVDQENAKRLFRIYNQIFLTGQPAKGFDGEIVKKDGTKRFVEASVSLIKDSKGQPAGFRGIARDITERKHIEEALDNERERFKTISESAPFGMVVLNKDGIFSYINHRFSELFGYDLKDIPNGKTWFRKAYPDSTYRHNVISAWIEDLNIFHPGEKRSRVVTVTCKDGTEKIANIISVQLETGENLITCEDITEHMRFEEALREKEERYRTLFEGSRDAVYITTLEGKFVDFNQAFLELFGYGKEELLELRSQDSYAHPDDRYQFRKEIEKNGFVRDYEVKLRKKDGREMDCLLTASVRRGIEGTILGYQGIIRDITDRKRAEQEMKVLEDQLLQSQKMEAVGRLAGGIAHDFNNILTIIKGYGQLSLSDLKEDHHLRENIEGIIKATDRATDLIRKILAFSRRQVMEMKVLDLNILLTDLEKLLRRIIGEDIELMITLDKDLGRVKADPGQIEQVILNLAVNAKDAMPKGGRFTLETDNAELDDAYARSHLSVIPGHYVVLSVSDTGVGMSPEVRERIFDPFYTTKETGKGTGLGLSTAYGIVKQSGGNIWVYSEPGQGTTFKIYLPRQEDSLEEVREKDVREELPRGSETVLVVEDEEVLRKLAIRILDKQGYKTLEASQGNEALSICEQHKEPINLLLTDVVMPGMSGRELSSRLSPFHPEVKTLYMSGHASHAIMYHGVLEPGVNLLQKPFTPEALARKVRESLDKKST
jgi:two-component system cell cycle sensor histidine kinase/response regulator CckA